MNKSDELKTRIILAKSIKVSPDSISPINMANVEDKEFFLYGVEYKGNCFCVGFDKVPTIEDARTEVKDLYLCAMEWEFDEEFEE